MGEIVDKDKIEKEELQKSLRQSFTDLQLTKTALIGNIEDMKADDLKKTLIPFYNGFYFFCGQFFKNCGIKFGAEVKDLRYSYVEIGDSRTGKGQRIKTIKDIANNLTNRYNHTLRWTKCTEFTTAGLVGTIDRNAMEYNTKNNLHPDSDKYKEPIIYGDLFNYDMIFFEEAKSLLEASPYTTQLLTILQEALDTPGDFPGSATPGYNIRKKLGADLSIQYNCRASIYATTYYLKEVSPVLFEQGFFQRVGIHYSAYTNKQTISLRRKILEMYKTPIDQEEYFFRLNLFCERIMKLKKEGNPLMRITPPAYKKLEKILADYEEILDKSQGVQNTIMKSMSQTVLDIAIKFGAIHALLRGSIEIEERDITSSYETIRETINTIFRHLDPETRVSDPKRRLAENCYYALVAKQKDEKDFKVTKTLLIDEVCANSRLSRGKAKALIDNLITTNILKEEQGERNTKFLELIEDNEVQ